MRGIQPVNVDEYIAQVPDDQRPVLARLRELIRSIAPDAVESISYGIPTYKLAGKPLVYFGTARTHYAVYALSGAVRETYADELAGFSMSKGTIRFPFNKPFPAALVKRLIEAQIKENQARQKGPKTRN